MTNIPGLYAAGECDYQYHGANRLGANALLSCLVGGEIAAQGVMAYLKQTKIGEVNPAVVEDARREKADEYTKLRQSNGSENPYKLHAELADVMWNNCGIWRVQKDLIAAQGKLDELSQRARQVNLIDDSGWNNQAVPFARAVQNMIEQGKAIVGGAMARDESRGAHFKMDTPDRDDTNWLKSTLATWTPTGPTFRLEDIDCRYIAPRARKYRINQNKIVKDLMGEEYLAELAIKTEA
jgi:succinate dehydrogenase / fumarate reductase flavoprotein subunit